MIGQRIGRVEFVALIAMLFATIAFSIDAMLPALPEIARELTPAAPNRAQLILTTFLFGMGAATLIAGPLSDAMGRKPVLLWGIGLYLVGGLVASVAQSLPLLLAARIVQGLGAAGPRIVSIAVVRDLYSGREMARIMSFVMLVFTIVPAVAPSVGALIIAGFGWRTVFAAFILFAAISACWLWLRLNETVAIEARRPMRIATLRTGLAEVLSRRAVVIYIAVLTLGFGQMFALLSSAQPVFDISYGRAASFPLWFAAMAVLSAGGSVTNAALVMRLGMRRLATTAYAVQTVLALVLASSVWLGMWPGGLPFWLFFPWAVSVFLMAGLTFGNLNALALQPLGHIAGLAASVVGAVSTVLSVLIAVPIGLAFDGTPLPLLVGTFLCSALALTLMRMAPQDTGIASAGPPGGAPAE